MTVFEKVLNEDCFDVLRRLKAEQLDLVVTDPPYGYSFMGKHWDRAVPSAEIWKECLRVLKPGAFCLVMSAPRQDCLSRMIVNLQDAGFRIDFTSIYHTYASGFPKAGNISKLVNKRLGAEREVKGVSPNWRESKRGREKFGSMEVRGENAGLITVPASPEAKALDGSYAGYQPKPAVEVVLVCMKPLSEKTYLDQALKNRKGITWFDDCKIPYQGDSDKASVPQSMFNSPTGQTYGFKTGEGRNGEQWDSDSRGRFPANLLVSDDALNDGKVRSSCRSTKMHPEYAGESLTGFLRGDSSPGNQYADSGSYSRYFDLDAWDKQSRKVFPFIIVPKASKKEKNQGLEDFDEKVADPYGQHRGRRMENNDVRFDGKPPAKGRNTHPTVKPLKLMRYLVSLFSRPGDVVMDPFMGSGSTGMACKSLGRSFVGVELEEEYCRIAEARIASVERVGK